MNGKEFLNEAVRLGIVHPAAVEDPDGYDKGVTLTALRELHLRSVKSAPSQVSQLVRNEIAIRAMEAIIADPEELPRERIPCALCNGVGEFCKSCSGAKTVEASCARSVAIKAVRYADELIDELERTKT